MRNFSNRGGFKSFNTSSSYGRDRRNDRDDNFRPGVNKRPADRNSREFGEKRFRRSFDNDNGRSYSNNQDRRGDGGGSLNRSFRGGRNRDGRSDFRDPKPHFRNNSPPSRFKSDTNKRSESRGGRSNDFRRHSPSPVAPKFRERITDSRTSFKSQSVKVRKPIRSTGGNRIMRRSDIRSRLSGRPLGGTGSREYLKRIKEARSKMNDTSRSDEEVDDDGQKNESEMEDADKKSKADENEEDFLDIANDVDLDDGEASTSKVKNETKKATTSTVAEDKSQKAADEEELQEKSTKNDEKDENDSETESVKKSQKKTECLFICLQCGTKARSDREYLTHLRRSIHIQAMRKAAMKTRMLLNTLRKYQRERQFAIETKVEKVEDIPSKYCQVCKLYYRQSKSEHRDSADHKKIREFLHPYCKICRIRFMAPMKFEEHKCSLNHLKIKARRAEHEDEEDDEFDMKSLDFGEFKTVDSVGDVDGEEEDDSCDNSRDVAVGCDFVSAKQVLVCDLCEEVVTFDMTGEDQKLIEEHCKSRKHNRLYRRKQEEEEETSKKSDESNGKLSDAEPSTSKSVRKNSEENDEEMKSEVEGKIVDENEKKTIDD